MKEYEFHPLAGQYPLMADDQLGELVELMQQYGFIDAHPIVLHEGKILAGRDRYRAARRAGVPICVVDLQEGIPPEVYVEIENEHRKHLTPEFLAARKRARVERVAEKRREGKSQRAIAEEEGVSRAQVVADLKEASTGQGCPVEPPEGKVTGKDGKKRDASKPKRPEPWDGGVDTAEGGSADPAAPEPLFDGKGLPVPESLRETWGSLAEYDRIKRGLEQIERDMSALANAPGGEFLAENLQGAKDDTYRCDHLRRAILLLKNYRPWLSRCPECLGQKRKDSKRRCVACKELGWVTADTYNRSDLAGTRAIERLVAEQEEAGDE